MNSNIVHPIHSLPQQRISLPRPEENKERTVLNHYRVTLPANYTADCPGRDNLSGRQGHYVWACCPLNAAQQVQKEFTNHTEFDVQEW